MVPAPATPAPHDTGKLVKSLQTQSFHPVLEREEATLVLFSDFMKRKQVTATPPQCETPFAMAKRPGIVKVAKGFMSMIMSSPSEEEAVTCCLDKYPILKALDDAHAALFGELLVLTGVWNFKDGS